MRIDEDLREIEDLETVDTYEVQEAVVDVVDAMEVTDVVKRSRKSGKKDKNNFATFWDSAATRGKNRIIQNTQYRDELNKVRASYGPDVMKAVVFNLDHPMKEEFLEMIEDVKERFKGKRLEDSISPSGEYIYTADELAMIEVAKRANV